MRLSQALSAIDFYAQEVGTDPELLVKILAAENFGSGKLPQKDIDLDPTKVNEESGAAGLMQFTSRTWNSLIAQGKLPADADRTDPETSIKAAAILMKENLARYKGNPAAATAAYYGGIEDGNRVAAGGEPAGPLGRDYLVKTGFSPKTTGTSAGYSLRGHVADPAAFNSIVEATVGRVNAIQGEIGDAVSARAGIAKELGSAAFQAASAEADKYAAEAGVETKRIEHKRGILQTFGFDTSPDSALMRSEVEIQKARKIQAELKAEFDKLSEISIFENPVGWLMAQFQLPTVVQKHNNARANELKAEDFQKETRAKIQIQQQIDTPGVIEDVNRAVSANRLKATAEAAIKAHQASLASYEDTIRFLYHKSNNEQWAGDKLLQVMKFTSDSFSFNAAQKAASKAEEEEQNILTLVNANNVRFGLKPYATMKEWAATNPDPAERAKILKVARNEGTTQDVLQFLISTGAAANLPRTDPAAYSLMGKINQAPEVKARIQDAMNNPQSKDHAAYLKNPDSFMTQAWADYIDTEDRKLTGGKGGKGIVTFHADLPPDHFRQIKHAQAWNLPELRGNWVAEQLALKRQAADSPASYAPTTRDVLGIAQAKVIADPTSADTVAKELHQYFVKMAQKNWEQGQSSLKISRPQAYLARVDEMSQPLNLLGSPAEVMQWLTKVVIGDTSWVQKQQYPMQPSNNPALAPFSIGP